MGHRFYIWTNPKDTQVKYTEEEILKTIRTTKPKLADPSSSFMFREFEITNSESPRIKFKIAKRRFVPITSYVKSKDSFESKKMDDWDFILSFWDIRNEFIEVRGGIETAETVFNEMSSIFRRQITFKPLEINNKAFSFLSEKRIDSIDKIAFHSEGGYAKFSGIYLKLTDLEDFKRIVKQEQSSKTIGGFYRLPETLSYIPLLLDQKGKIQFIKFSTENGTEGYEELTREVVLDILKFCKKYEKS